MSSFYSQTREREKAMSVIVIGGGHAGIEAVCAAARLGCKAILITHKKHTIGVNSCNPSWGGIGKGTLIREIDALGGVCAKIVDKSGIKFNVLNRSKGSAVFGPRAQVDRELYRINIYEELIKYSNVSIVEGSVEDLIFANNVIQGVKLSNGESIFSDATIITTGTFLQGKIQIGVESFAAGRMGDMPSLKLSNSLSLLGIKLSRLRTGTPPRLDRSSINFNELPSYSGELPPLPFSFLNDFVHQTQQIPSYLTFTNRRTHEIINNNLHLNNHVLQDTMGPRYCPSLESKVIKFPSKSSHHVWLEIEGINSNIVYPNGLSMTFSPDTQLEIIRSIKGLEAANIIKPGYGVTYDYVDPRQLDSTLKVKHLKQLYLAGQINGTTGYEEAACQGLIAGCNAALAVLKLPPFTLNRAEALTGVLIDDLTTKGADEPYRMFTSRAEYRIILRSDNADLRLTEKGYKVGLVDKVRFTKMNNTKTQINEVTSEMKSIQYSPHQWSALGFTNVAFDGKAKSLFDKYHSIPNCDLFKYFRQFTRRSVETLARVRVDSKYQDYVELLREEINYLELESKLELPRMDYSVVGGLSNEVVEKLNSVQPTHLGQIKSIQGITGDTPGIVMRYLKSRTYAEVNKYL
eukprot:NODE_677_length_5302_cov_0.446089.p1 type:complete len:632 gc:universal NODE_677_length_5302_cov_0.446089:1369-3264(+)